MGHALWGFDGNLDSDIEVGNNVLGTTLSIGSPRASLGLIVIRGLKGILCLLGEGVGHR